MATLRYSVAPEIFARFPGYVRGVLVFEQLHNPVGDARISALLRDAEEHARGLLPANVADLPQVAAWRAAYRQFGARPSEHRSSIEALLRRVAKPDALPGINALVDIGNIVSLRHRLPAGVHPIPPRDVALELRAARAGDVFLAVENEAVETVPAGEIVLATGSEVLTRRWTWRQSAVTRTLADTTRVFFNIDGLPPTTVAEVHAAMGDVAGLVHRFCGGRLVQQALLEPTRAGFTAPI